MKIYLFGSTGMLGTYVYKVLSKYYEVECITRDNFNILNDNWNKLTKIMSNVQKNDIIINCAGVIPQKTLNNEYKKYIKINTLFPHKLHYISDKVGARFIHITTNCVFNGKKGDYIENDISNETNIYGITKSLGEPENTTIIRTSIIGEELTGKNSLLEWVKSKKNGSINGYTNHLWNGITCLTLSKIIKNIIINNLYWNGCRHIYTNEIVSKYELLCIFNEIYNLNIRIIPIQLNNSIDKTLSSTYKNTFNINSIREQIIIQKEFCINN